MGQQAGEQVHDEQQQQERRLQALVPLLVESGRSLESLLVPYTYNLPDFPRQDIERIEAIFALPSGWRVKRSIPTSP